MKKLIYLTLPLFLAACGGEGDSSSVTASPTLNASAAFSSYIVNGSSVNAIISGACAGTRKLTYSATYSGKTFAGIAALVSNNSEVDNLVPNSPAPCLSFYSSNNGGQVYKVFYDPTTVLPLTSGSTPPGYVYSNQQPLSTSVTAGSKGTIATYLDYTGTTAPVRSGVISYEITADTPTSLLFTTTDASTVIKTGERAYDSITTYRLNANNTLTDLRKNIQIFSGLTGVPAVVNIYEVYQ